MEDGTAMDGKPMAKLVILLLLLGSIGFAQTPEVVRPNLRALVIAHSAALTWHQDLTSGTVTGYRVYRANVSGGPYTIIAPLSSNTPTAYTDASGLAEGSTYFYVVTATGPGGESAYSNQASALIPFQAPPAPTGLVATSK